MSLKHAVLALLTERRGYGYDLAQRFRDRVGPGWQLNPSAIYPALDQLERAGLVTAAPQGGGSRRSPRVIYVVTPTGVEALDVWLRTTDAAPEPVRSDLHLKLAFATTEHREAIAAQLAGRRQATVDLLAETAAVASAGHARLLIDAAVAARLRADLAWLQATHAAVEASSG